MSDPVVLLTTNLARGGAETQVAQLALKLRERGWNTSVISLVEPSAFTDELLQRSVPVFSLGMQPGRPDPRALVRLLLLLRKLRPRILHAHMFHANLTARLARLIVPVPVVVSTLHSIAETARRSADIHRRDRLYQFTDCLSDATVAVSQAVADRHLNVRAVSSKRLRVIPNGVDTDRYRPDAARRARTRESLGLGNEFAWLAAGRLMWKKDYATMIRAMAEQRSSVLLIAGTGLLESELRALARELSANVRFLGMREDIPSLMNACDGLVLSSLIEGLPMVLLEAASSGLPCVACAVGGVSEVVVDGETGYLVRPEDPASLAAAMSHFSELSIEKRSKMADAARAHAVAHFDLRLVASLWENLYRQLLESARSSDREIRHSE